MDFHGQRGLISGFFCKTQVVSFFQELPDALNIGKSVESVIVYFAKAFDVVPQKPLLEKHLMLGIGTCEEHGLKKYFASGNR